MGVYFTSWQSTTLYITTTKNTQNENFSPIQSTIIVKLKTLKTQIEKYTYRPPKQTVTNCHIFKKGAKNKKRQLNRKKDYLENKISERCLIYLRKIILETIIFVNMCWDENKNKTIQMTEQIWTKWIDANALYIYILLCFFIY